MMTAEEKIDCLEKKLKQALSWWRTAEKKLSRKCAETKANQKSIEQLKSENAALRDRLEKAVELPFVPTYYHIETWLSELKVSLTDESAAIVVPVYVYQKFDNSEAAEARLAELKGGTE